MTYYDFSDPDSIRAALGPVQGRTLPDMIRLALAAAYADGESVENLGYPSARNRVTYTLGFDLNARILEILDATPAARPDIVRHYPAAVICSWCKQPIREGTPRFR